jgi:hypothetical protein
MAGITNALTMGRTPAPSPNMLTRRPAAAAQPEQPIGQVTGQDAGGGLWVKTQDGQEIALPADRINVRDGMAYALPPQEVGLGGKALGALGLDLDGDRGRTSWGNALTNSAKARGGRGNILPVDESGLAVPGMIAQPIEDFNAMSPQNSVEENSRLSFSAAGLAPTVGFGASAAGAVPEGAVAANRIGARIRAYRGTAWPEAPETIAQKGQMWASSDPGVANKYAGGRGDISPMVYPLDMEFTNPLVIDAAGNHFSEVPYQGGVKSTDDIVRDARLSGEHDGVLFNNVVEYFDEHGNVPTDNLATTAVALKPGTVRSATTGDLLYSNSPTGASIPLLQRLLGQRGGQAAAADTGAIAQEMAALQQRHAELFGNPYRTPQPPNGATPETMAADLAELRGRIQSKEGQLAAQPQGPSVPAAGAPRLPAVQPNPNVAKRVAEFGEIQEQVSANPYVQTRNEKGQFVKKAEEKRLVHDYYTRRGEPLPEGPWGREKTQYQDVAKAQQQFEQAKRGITQTNTDIAKQQQATRAGKGNAAELKRLREENEMYKANYARLSKLLKPDDE